MLPQERVKATKFGTAIGEWLRQQWLSEFISFKSGRWSLSLVCIKLASVLFLGFFSLIKTVI